MGIRNPNCKHFDGFLKCNKKPRNIWGLWLFKPVCILFVDSIFCDDMDKIIIKPTRISPAPQQKNGCKED